nr:hypothetical protein [Tanacetum cinerariifolium]
MTKVDENVEIVLDDGDEVLIKATPISSRSPTIIDYKIHKEGKKNYFKIIRADGNSQVYQTFEKMFKNFNREDLEVMWAIVKDRFKKEKPVDDMDNILFKTLKTMFEHHVEDTIRKYQQGLAKVYPLTWNTLHQLWSDVRQQVDYDVEMAYDLLRFIRKQLMEGYTPWSSRSIQLGSTESTGLDYAKGKYVTHPFIDKFNSAALYLLSPQKDKDPSKVTPTELTGSMVSVNNNEKSINPLPFPRKDPKSKKPPTETKVTPPTGLTEGSKKSHSVSSSKASDDEKVFSAGEEMDEDISPTDEEVKSLSPNKEQPELSHAQESASDSSSPELKKYDNILPLTKRQLVKYLRKVSWVLFNRLTEDQWEKHKEAAVSYDDFRASIKEYYEDIVDHRDQTDKLI